MKKARKIAVLVGDGMGDEPIPSLDNHTPLQVAAMPEIRRVAATGHVQLVRTVPDGMAPGSDVANMGLLGYHAGENYTGRAAIEAAGAHIPLAPNDVAYRVNLVTVHDNKIMEDYSAGDMPTEQGRELIASLEKAAGREGLHFHGGVSYRHLLVWRDGPTALSLIPPHEIAGKPILDFLPSGPRQSELRALMDLSREVFANHPVNKERQAAGLRPATQIWPWGCGKAMRLQSYQERYGLKGGIITAVDLIRGLGELCGLDVIRVPGATGWTDTDYSAKARAAINCLLQNDFVYVHVEAPDECGHKGLAEEKIQAIESISTRIVGPVWASLEAAGKPYRLIVCTDHRTPTAKRGHTSDPVPFAWVDGPLGSKAFLRDLPPAAFDEFIPLQNANEKPQLVCHLMDQLLHH